MWLKVTRTLRWTVIAVGASFALVAVSLYLWVGNPKALYPQARLAPDAAHQMTPDQIATLAERLAERLKRSPDDAHGWVMLARSYTALGRWDPAAQAYAQAAKLVPNDAGLLADYADALAKARGRKLDGEPFEIVKRALEADPNHVKSLALAGSAEFERKSYAAAVGYWERIVPLVDADSEFGRSIQRSIGQARDLGKLPSRRAAVAPAATSRSKPPAAAAAAPTTSAIPSAAAITGTARLAPALASQVAPGDALFIFARAAEGARTTLAVVRVRAGHLPYEFRLDDSQALTPDARLSVQGSVVVTARISKSGNAIAKPGDLQGSSKPVAPGATGLELVIDQVRR